MFIGHYGVAFGARAFEKRIPLWVYFIAVQWVDILWCIFIYLGVERVRVQPGVNPSGPFVFEFYPYTHSLVAGIGWAALAFVTYLVLARERRSKIAAAILAFAVLSHWLLDFVVHQPDLDLINESYKVGLGLWNYPLLELVVEFALVVAGLLLYFRKSPELSLKRRIALIVLCLVIATVQIGGNFGPPPSSVKVMAVSGLAIYLVFALWAFFAEGRPRIEPIEKR